jgi:hypothetical protein
VIPEVKKTVGQFSFDLPVVLNTVPLAKLDFDNAVEKVFGQGFESLAEIVEVFEVMSYHQILKRPPQWISRTTEEVKARRGRTDVCALLYSEGLAS